MGEFTPVEAQTIQGLQGAVDNLPNIIGNAVSMIQGYIRSGGFTVGGPGTVPDQFRLDAIAIARWRLLSSIPDLGDGFLTKGRKDAYDDAIKRLEKIARREMNVESPNASAPSGNWQANPKLLMRTQPLPDPAVQGADAGANLTGPTDT